MRKIEIHGALTREHALVGSVGDGENVRRQLVPPLVDVHPDGRLGVDGKAAVGVHGHAEQAGVGLIHASC